MLAKYLSVFLWAMVPLVELRGAIPIAYGIHAVDPEFNLKLAYVLIAIGNMLPVPFFFFTAPPPIFSGIKHSSLYQVFQGNQNQNRPEQLILLRIKLFFYKIIS